MIRVAELVDKSLCLLSLLHDALLVVLPQGSGQLIVVHGRPVFSLAPQGRNPVGIHNLEDAALPVQPVDAARVHVWCHQQLLDKLPQVDAGRGAAWLGHGACTSAGGGGGCGG